jgi:hypothetical protein
MLLAARRVVLLLLLAVTQTQVGIPMVAKCAQDDQTVTTLSSLTQYPQKSAQLLTGIAH